MKKLNTILSLGAGALLMLASCSTSYNAMRGETDDLYFMASDATIATEFAVKNNNPKNFQSLNEVSPTDFEQENFSARNVNPEYIAKYQNQNNEAGESGTVYFDETEAQESSPNVNVYNNYYNNAGNLNSGFGSPWGFNPMFMGMGGFGMMNPWMNPMMMGGFYDPFWGPGFGMRSGFGLSVGMGFGMGFNRFGMGFGNPWMMGSRFGMMGMGLYDPFWGPGFGGLGYGGFYPGYGLGGFGRPIFVLPGSEFNNRQIVRGARPSRGAGFAPSGVRSNAVAAPSTSRAAARREATSNRTLTSTPTSRASARDFSNSQNDFYNTTRSRVSTSAAPINRNIGSPATTRSGSRIGNSSAIPSYRNVAPNTRTNRSSYGATPSRRSAPSYNRSASPSYNRSTSPAYNRSSTPSGGRMMTPSRSSSPSFSTPSRSSGGGASVGGGRSSGGSSSGGSRGGRGN